MNEMRCRSCGATMGAQDGRCGACGAAPSSEKADRGDVLGLLARIVGPLLVGLILVAALWWVLAPPRLLMSIGRSKQSVARADTASIAQMVAIWMADREVSRLPGDFTLDRLCEGDSPYLSDADLIDPWGRPYEVVIPGAANADFDVVSLGADGLPGGDGEDADVTN